MAVEETRPVSIRVPITMPDKMRALTGLSFSQAVVQLVGAFIAAQEGKTPPPPNKDS